MTMPQTRHYEMKDSGFGDIREMPKHWQMLRIKNRYSVLCGATPSENSENWDGDINWIGPADMDDFGKIKEGKRTITQTGYDSCGTHLIPAGSVILSTRAPIGKVQIAEAELCTNQGCKSMVRMFTDDSTQFLAYYLFAIKERLQEAGTGTTFKELSTANLKNMPFLLPSPQEQTAIAAYLDEKCATIDAIIAEAKSSIEEYKSWKASVIFETVTKGLNPNAEMKDSGVEWIGEIPKGWNLMPFGKIASIKACLVPPKEYPLLPQISPDNIEKGSARLLQNYKTVQESGVISWNHHFYKGQIIYSKVRPTLNKLFLAQFEGLCSADMYPIETTQDARYLVYAMLSGYFVQQVAAITANRVKMPKINKQELSKITVLLPPLSEQASIVSYLDRKCSLIDGIILEKEELIKELENYKRSLIFEVVTGKRRVC